MTVTEFAGLINLIINITFSYETANGIRAQEQGQNRGSQEAVGKNFIGIL